MRIKVESEIPIGAGLGSSAALSVCLAAGLLDVNRHLGGDKTSALCNGDDGGNDVNRINDLAFLSEKILHGRPSGVDNAVSAFGGVISFVGGKVEPLSRPPALRVVLVDSSVQRSTRQVVAAVGERLAKTPAAVGALLDEIGDIAEECFRLLQDDDEAMPDRHERLGALVVRNQERLAGLGVSHPRLEDICATAKDFGLAAKLTGAGGGGFALVLIPPTPTAEASVVGMKATLEAKGYTCRDTLMGVEGVTVRTVT